MNKKTISFLCMSFIVSFLILYIIVGLRQGTLFDIFKSDTNAEIEPSATIDVASTTASTTLTNTVIEKEEFLIPPTEVAEETIVIAFVGDMMFDRYMRRVANDFGYGYILEGIDKYLNKLDLVVGNLEGPITSLPSESIGTSAEQPGHFQFTFSPNILPVLVNAGFQAVNIGNNHIMNFGTNGLEDTRTFLDSFGMQFFGDPYKKEHETAALLVDQVAVGLVSYNEFINPNKFQTIENITSFKKDADLIAVMTHWGQEYETTPTPVQISLAHEFIDAGADIIIGTHPHVIQNKEIYKGKHIYYSLGNFVFDQYFSDEVRCGAIVELHINPEKPNKYEVIEKFSELVSSGQTILSDCKSEVPIL